MLQIKTDLYRYVHYTSNVAVCNYQELIGCDVSFMVVLISERHGGLFCKYCRMYLIEGVCIFIAVLPIICIVIRSGQDYWLGLLLSEVYSFITIFIGNLGAVSKLYPILAALTLSGYYESDLTEKFLCLLSMILCLLLSAILMGWHGKKAE